MAFSKVIVVGGGISVEREVSIRSASCVYAAVRAAGFEVEYLDYQGDFKVFQHVSYADIVLPILHGVGGEDGVIQEYFESRRIRFLGSGSASSRLSIDKWATRKRWASLGLPVAPGMLVGYDEYWNCNLTSAPHVLKTCRGGSSIGVYVVRDPLHIDSKAVDHVFGLDDDVFVEQYCSGVEITVSILKNKALPIVEIQPPPGDFFSFENKYNGSSAETCPPISIDNSTQEAAKKIGLAAHNAVDARHLSRVDMIVGANGGITLLEINSMPGMTNESLYPKSALVEGLDMPALIKELIYLVDND
jgi:D-alanine-D-alanine ligase